MMSNVQKSFTTMGLQAVLGAVTNAVIEAEKKAKSSREIQSLDILRPGLRQDLYIGKLMVVPYNVMEDVSKVPLPLLKGATLSLFDGEEASCLEAHRLAETEFDELEPKDFVTYKDKVFRDEDGKLGCLCVFLPAWSNPRDYAGFRFVKDATKLEQLIRHLVFSAYFKPSLSAMFDILEEDQLKLDAVNIQHEHMGPMSELMAKSNTYPVLESGATKTAGVARKPLLRFAASEINSIKEEFLSPEEKAVMDQLSEAVVSKASSLSDGPTGHTYNHSNGIVPQRGGYNDRPASEPVTNACRKCNESLDGNKSDYYCDKCNMPLKKYAEGEEPVEASMMRIGDEDGAVVSGPNTDEDLIIAIAKDAEDLVSEKYLALGDSLDLVENVDSGAYDLALEEAIYEIMEKKSIPYHDAEEVAAKVKEYLTEEWDGETTEGWDEEKVDGLDPELEAELNSVYGDPDIDIDAEESKTSSKKVAFIDFFGKCEKCGALVGVPPGSAPEGHAILCPKCQGGDNDPKKTSSKKKAGNPTAGSVGNHKAEPKKATPTSWSVDNTRPEPSTLPQETTEEQIEAKEKTTPSINTSVSASLKFAKATEYFDVVREELQEPEEAAVTDDSGLDVPTEVQTAADVLSEDFAGQRGLGSKPDYDSEKSVGAIEPEDAEKEPKKTPEDVERELNSPAEEKPEPKKTPEDVEKELDEPKPEEKAKEEKEEPTPKQGGLKKKLNKEAITYQHPGDGLHALDMDQEDVLLRPESLSAPKISKKKLAFDWATPGQVLREFQPGLYNQLQDQMHDRDDYFPVEESMNKPTSHPGEPSRDESNAEEKHTLTSPGLVSTESGGGTPLRSQERNIRGPFFMDQFYKIHADIAPANLTVKSSSLKTASNEEKQSLVSDYLLKLSAEIGSSLLAACMVTDKPSFVGVPTEGTIDLSNGWTEMNSMFATANPMVAQLKSLFESISDSELSDAINDAWSQAAVWKSSGIQAFLYEVFVRIESVDTETMLVKYKFITSLKEK
jgi:hypothetical protein